MVIYHIQPCANRIDWLISFSNPPSDPYPTNPNPPLLPPNPTPLFKKYEHFYNLGPTELVWNFNAAAKAAQTGAPGGASAIDAALDAANV